MVSSFIFFLPGSRVVYIVFFRLLRLGVNLCLNPLWLDLIPLHLHADTVLLVPVLLIVTTYLWLDLIPLHPAETVLLVRLLETVLGLLWLDLIPLHPGLAGLVFSHLLAETVLLVPVQAIVATLLW